MEMNIRGYGFFPTPRAPRVFWIGIEAGPALPALAALVDEKLATVAVPAEDHAYRPHLTLARGPGGSGSPKLRKGDGSNRIFQSLQERLAPLPALEFGAMTAREFFLYQSQLSSGGSKYTKLASFPLGGSKTQ
jgi:2'-5' RNA ligase